MLDVSAPLHPDADGVGVDHHRVDGQHVAHTGGLAHGGHDRHTEQPSAGRVFRGFGEMVGEVPPSLTARGSERIFFGRNFGQGKGLRPVRVRRANRLTGLGRTAHCLDGDDVR